MTTSNSRAFDPQWFVSVINNQDESWRVDFKSQHYKLGNDDANFKVARHLIAFANVARRIGQPCWMFFGVNENSRQPVDISSDYPGDKIPEKWKDPNIAIRQKQKDLVEEKYRKIAVDWIGPDIPDFHLEFGRLHTGEFVSYIAIEPTPSSKPFYLKKKLPRSSYDVGTVFVRRNTSSVPVASSEVNSLLKASEADYLSKSDWENLISAHKAGDFHKFEHIFPTFEHRDRTTDEIAFEKITSAVSQGKNCLVVADAGFGKTVLLHRVAYRLASIHNGQFRNRYYGQSEIDIDISEEDYLVKASSELEVVPEHIVPVFISLRMTISSIHSFEKIILKKIREITGNKKLNSLQRLLKIPGSRWLIILDGIDELRRSEVAGEVIHEWVNDLPDNVAVVISSRPYAVYKSPGIEVIDLDYLSREEVDELITNHFLDAPEGIAFQVKGFIQKNEELYQFLCCPRAMDGFLKYIKPRYNPPQPSIDLDRVHIDELESIDQQVTGRNPVPILNVATSSQSGFVEGVEDTYIDEDVYVLPSMAEVMKAISDHMREEEIKRQTEWGKNPFRIADCAQNSLEKTAWYLNWREIAFDLQNVRERKLMSYRNLEWNLNIGFVRRINNRICEFCSKLFQHYEAAQYGYSLDEKLIRTEIERKIHDDPDRNVINLLNQLRISNGLEEISI